MLFGIGGNGFGKLLAAVEIDLIEHKDAGRVRKLEEFDDSFFHVTGLKAGVGNEDDRVTVLHGAVGGLYHEIAQRVFGLEDARSVEKDELIVAARFNARNAVARGLGLGRNDGDLLSQNAVEQGRFSHVGAPYD